MALKTPDNPHILNEDIDDLTFLLENDVIYERSIFFTRGNLPVKENTAPESSK